MGFPMNWHAVKYRVLKGLSPGKQSIGSAMPWAIPVRECVEKYLMRRVVRNAKLWRTDQKMKTMIRTTA